MRYLLGVFVVTVLLTYLGYGYGQTYPCARLGKNGAIRVPKVDTRNAAAMQAATNEMWCQMANKPQVGQLVNNMNRMATAMRKKGQKKKTNVRPSGNLKKG